MSDDHDWVARLLADSGPVAMPDDVSDRLERALRDAAARPALTTPAASSDGPADRDVPPGPAGPAPQDVQGAVPPAAPVAAGAVPPAAATTGSLPRLRSVPLGSEDTGPSTEAGSRSHTGAGNGSGAASTTGTASPTSRRELRDDDVGERRRRLLTRWAPVAAGVLLLGGAGAAALSQLQGGGDQATSAAESASDSAAGSVAAAPPRSLVASGTEYGTADQEAFAEQVRALVALTTDPLAEGGADAPAPASAEAGGAAGQESAGAQESAPADEASAEALAVTRSAADSPLSDPAVLSECVSAVTEGTSTTAAAVDLALVDGVESTVVVVPDAAGLTFQVYVVGPDCSNIDTVFDFFTVAP